MAIYLNLSEAEEASLERIAQDMGLRDRELAEQILRNWINKI